MCICMNLSKCAKSEPGAQRAQKQLPCQLSLIEQKNMSRKRTTVHMAKSIVKRSVGFKPTYGIKESWEWEKWSALGISQDEMVSPENVKTNIYINDIYK